MSNKRPKFQILPIPKTNWCLGLIAMSNHHGADDIDRNSILSIKKKKNCKECLTLGSLNKVPNLPS